MVSLSLVQASLAGLGDLALAQLYAPLGAARGLRRRSAWPRGVTTIPPLVRRRAAEYVLKANLLIIIRLQI